MSNGTRKKKVDFKKLLIIEEEPNSHFKKKSNKSSNKSQNDSNKKEKSQKNSQKPKDNKEKMAEKSNTKKIKLKNLKGKDQLTINDFTETLNDFKEEFIFLNKKRNADINIEKVANIQKNIINKINGAINNDNKKNIKATESILNEINYKNSNEDKNDINQNASKNENKNQISSLLTDFYKLFLHLFESNRLDNSKPYKFVDYLIASDNLLLNIKKDKAKFEEIKRGVGIKSKNNIFLINDHLVNKNIYEYLKCDFSHSFMKKLCEKINIFLMNKKRSGTEKDTMSFEKKDKFTYSNFLADKLKENVNKSILSFTNDTEYFKSLIYVCNKYSKYTGKKEMPEKILIESLEKNKKILEKFKIEGDDKILALKEEKEFLDDLLKSKKIRKYINKKFGIFDLETIKSNKILNALNLNLFYKIFEIIIKNKNDDDNDKLYKILQEEIILPNNEKLEKIDVKNFLIEFRFLLDIELSKFKFSNNEKNINEISILEKIYNYINEYLIKYYEEENISGKKGKTRSRAKIKSKKDSSFVDNENDSVNSEINITNNMSIELNENPIIQNKIITNEDKNDNNKSKTVPFKIPYAKNNNNLNNNININLNPNSKAGLFEINTINEDNIEENDNNINKKNINKNIDIILGKEENKIEEFSETEKQDNKKIRIKKRRKIENKNKINEEYNHITFDQINSQKLKEMNIANIGKYLLNKLSLGQDIFKLKIEKPKFKNPKDNETINIKEDKENIKTKDSTKDIYRKDTETRENSSKSNSGNEKLGKIELLDNNPIETISPIPSLKDKNNSIKIINDSNQQITTDFIFSNHKPKNKNKNIENKRNIDTIKFNNIFNSDLEDDSIKEITRNNIKHSPNIGVKITRKRKNEIDLNKKNKTNKYSFTNNKNSIVKNGKGKNNNINIKIDRQSIEIKNGNIILN